jgi:N-acetyl-beta-hexosaminidase
MAFPRARALAETGWSREKNEFSNLVKRIKSRQGFLEKSDITTCPRME